MTPQIRQVLAVALFIATLFSSAPRLAAQQEDAKQKVAQEKGDKETADKAAPDWMQITTQPVQLRPRTGTISLRLDGDSRAIYEAIGKQGGISVLFDPDYIPRTIHVDANKVSLNDALQIVAAESRTFWRPVNSDTIFVAQDTQAKRREFEQSVYKTFYLTNVSQPSDIQDVVNALRTILEIQRIQQIPALDAILVRGTPAQIALSQKIIDDVDKARKKYGGDYRLEFKISELEDGKRLNSRNYTLLIYPHETGKLRIGTQVPIQTGDGKFTYTDVGQNIDCQIRAESERMVGVNVDMDFSNFGTTEQLRTAGGATSGNPVLQRFRITTKTDLELGKPTVINTFDDPSSKRTYQIEVTATRVREKE
ncbi:MAG TPA: hypothetical protein VKL40_12035 [Candidatus Angelobacter sp.]|nr:hypothetical protein [Candidatus Angelobacter sp.]